MIEKGDIPMKEFKTTAACIPSKHYMVDLLERVKEIEKLVDDGLLETGYGAYAEL